jgi:hypothetical protein
MASAKAIAKIIAVWILEAASGFLAIDFTADEPIKPIEIAGAIVPIAMTLTDAHKRTISMSILFENSKLQ